MKTNTKKINTNTNTEKYKYKILHKKIINTAQGSAGQPAAQYF